MRHKAAVLCTDGGSGQSQASCMRRSLYRRSQRDASTYSAGRGQRGTGDVSCVLCVTCMYVDLPPARNDEI